MKKAIARQRTLTRPDDRPRDRYRKILSVFTDLLAPKTPRNVE
jgi:hypothetical protein